MQALRTAFEHVCPSFCLSAYVSSDNLRLLISCRPAVSPPVKVQLADLSAVLVEKHVPHELLDLHALSQAAKDLSAGRNIEQLPVAAGQLPRPGRDGRLVSLVKHLNKKDAAEMIDPRYFRAFDNVAPGTVVARIYPPAEGRPGRDVFGTSIPAPQGKPFQIKPDPTVRVDPPAGEEQFSPVLAVSYGYLEMGPQNQIMLSKELKIRGDVDFHTGDIHFIGGVTISGSVRKGFAISAGDGIAVSGDVEGGRLFSAHGAIKIRGGATGHAVRSISGEQAAAVQLAQLGKLHAKSAEIAAAGGVAAAIAEGISIAANEDIEIEKECRNSLLRCRGAVLMPRGHLMTSLVHTTVGVEAGIIGTKAGADTVIKLCSNIESTPEYADLAYRLEAHQAAEEMLTLYLGPYAQDESLLKKLPRQKSQKLAPLLEKLHGVRESRKELERMKTDLLQRAEFRPVLRVNYLKLLFSGVRIAAGEDEFVVRENKEGKGTIRYSRADHSFSLVPYEHLKE